jgi:hypothetical protein
MSENRPVENRGRRAVESLVKQTLHRFAPVQMGDPPPASLAGYG